MDKYIRFFQEDNAWYVCEDGGFICTKLYGGFSHGEVVLALGVHTK